MEWLKAVHEKEYVLEIQAAILGKLAAEENSLKGLADDCKIVGPRVKLITKRARDVVEALSMLKY